MTINFIPNDPLSQDVITMRRKDPLPDRPEDLAGFTYKGVTIEGETKIPLEGEYELGTQEFLYWQCREAALAAIKVWETLDAPITQWARADDRKKLRLIPLYASNEINAYYSGNSLLFYKYTTLDNKTTYTGASTDVVSHETGHAFLDVIRPDLWNSPLLESNAFHEAFADCISLLAALSDEKMRKAVLPEVDSPNFVEALGEDIADGIRRLYESIPTEDPWRETLHNGTAPRNALNNLIWQLPESLQPVGPPSELVNEIHSFARVFTGCFYDTLRNIFASLRNQDETGLWTAAQTAGKLLIAGTRNAPEDPRFYQSVGRAMILADEQLNGGVNHIAIRNAFSRHGIALGSSSMLAPIAGLAGTTPRLGAAAKGIILPPETRKDLLGRIKASPNARLNVTVVNIGGKQIAQAVHYREVPLGKLDKRLKGVVAFAAEPVLVGTSGNKAAILGSLPEATTTNNEVNVFVESLLKHNSISFSRAEKVGKTHAVRPQKGKKVLTRIQFACKP